MPTYVYNCPACEKTGIERFVKMDDRDRQTCECGNFLSRQVTAPMAPIFKGVQATCSMGGVQRMPDVELTTDPK